MAMGTLAAFPERVLGLPTIPITIGDPITDENGVMFAGVGV